MKFPMKDVLVLEGKVSYDNFLKHSIRGTFFQILEHNETLGWKL